LEDQITEQPRTHTCKHCRQVMTIKSSIRKGVQYYRCPPCGRILRKKNDERKKAIAKIDSERRILFWTDPHWPHEHKHAFEFVCDIYSKYKCNKIICGGDLADSAGWGTYTKDPDGLTSAQEVTLSTAMAVKWYERFPVMGICRGNHDLRINLRLQEAGLPSCFTKRFNDVLHLPEKWTFEDYFDIDGVRYFHGSRYGKTATTTYTLELGMSNVSGHQHANAGIVYITNDRWRHFGVSSGCLIDTHSRAFAYGKDMTSRPVLGCSVVLENGQLPIFEPMHL
jgi:hypothetical protein